VRFGQPGQPVVAGVVGHPLHQRAGGARCRSSVRRRGRPRPFSSRWAVPRTRIQRHSPSPWRTRCSWLEGVGAALSKWEVSAGAQGKPRPSGCTRSSQSEGDPMRVVSRPSKLAPGAARGAGGWARQVPVPEHVAGAGQRPARGALPARGPRRASPPPRSDRAATAVTRKIVPSPRSRGKRTQSLAMARAVAASLQARRARHRLARAASFRTHFSGRSGRRPPPARAPRRASSRSAPASSRRISFAAAAFAPAHHQVRCQLEHRQAAFLQQSAEPLFARGRPSRCRSLRCSPEVPARFCCAVQERGERGPTDCSSSGAARRRPRGTQHPPRAIS